MSDALRKELILDYSIASLSHTYNPQVIFWAYEQVEQLEAVLVEHSVLADDHRVVLDSFGVDNLLFSPF